MTTVCTGATAVQAQTTDYQQTTTQFAEQQKQIGSQRHKFGRRAIAAARATIESNVQILWNSWLGTTWGLGPPQLAQPSMDNGKINCGTFVGRILHDAGFNVDVMKLQQQLAQDIIESFVSSRDSASFRVFRNKDVPTFISDMRNMGPGLYIIGLDFHVGLLWQTEHGLRFVHASYVTKTVVDEDAATASPIVDSKYRVVGKILTKANIKRWLTGENIAVKGNVVDPRWPTDGEAGQ
jgi:hypothetical protein